MLSQKSLYDSPWNCKKWRNDLRLCICELVVLINGALGKQREVGRSATNQPLHQNTTCTPLLCPLLLTGGTWEGYSFKNLKMVNETPMQAGYRLSFLSVLIGSRLMQWSFFHAWPKYSFQLLLGYLLPFHHVGLNQVIKGFPGTKNVEANSSKKLWFDCPTLRILLRLLQLSPKFSARCQSHNFLLPHLEKFWRCCCSFQTDISLEVPPQTRPLRSRFTSSF